MTKHQKNKTKKEGSGSGHVFFKALVLIAILGIGSLKGCLGWGGGIGDGKGNGEGDGKAENPILQEVVTGIPEISATPEATATPEITMTPSPTVTPAPKQLYVEIQQDIIVYQGKEFNTIQELLDDIKREFSDKQESEEKENIIIILNDEMAIENTFEDVKNALEKEGIIWVTPTPVPSN